MPADHPHAEPGSGTDSIDPDTIDAVLCDVDGVLRHFPSADALEAAHGLAPGSLASVAFAPKRLLPAITGIVTDEEWRACVAEGLVEAGHCATAAHARAVVEHWQSIVPRVDEEVAALLRRVREVVPVVLVSNATTALEASLGELGLGDFVGNLVNTSRIGVAKPDARVFEHAAQRAGVPLKRCLFIDDTLGHVESARGLGLQALHFHGSGALDRLRLALRPLLARAADAGTLRSTGAPPTP